MSLFINEDFMLQNKTAIHLYNEYAKDQPIYDYHCHIPPKEIWENRKFNNITELWLGGDHYKWRLMRSNGINEKFITGNASDRDKFQKFAETLPRAIGNPMFHWCHLELKNYFGYDGVLTGDTAQYVWDLTKEQLNDPDFCARNLITRSNVAMIGTTDDPCSDLKYHKLLKTSDFKTSVCPSFRPDPAINILKPGFVDYIHTLEKTVNRNLNTVQDVALALKDRMKLFNSLGCRAADHGLDYVPYKILSEEEINNAFLKRKEGKEISKEEADAYQTYLLMFCAHEYCTLDWVMQIHFSCVRNPNTLELSRLGVDSGFDCIAVTDSAPALYKLINEMYLNNSLPRTILYSLNPADDAWIDTLIGAFQSDEIPGKIQHGAAWWFNDHKLGMEKQITSLANLGILGNFIGMLTDSRSFLSYARHEYFRRILCNVFGTWMENGEYPMNYELAGKLVKDICSNNAKRYFRF